MPHSHSTPYLPSGIFPNPHSATVNHALMRMGLYLSLREKLVNYEGQLEPFDLSNRTKTDGIQEKPLDLSQSDAHKIVTDESVKSDLVDYNKNSTQLTLPNPLWAIISQPGLRVLQNSKISAGETTVTNHKF